eukprot:935746-Rhodomonas_salina.4
MEHGRLGNRTLIVWVCNRFDYRCNGPDRTPPYKPHFPEPEFYALYADAAQGRLGPNVHMVPYNTFERTYAKSLGVDMYAEVLRPSGLQALIDVGYPLTRMRGMPLTDAACFSARLPKSRPQGTGGTAPSSLQKQRHARSSSCLHVAMTGALRSQVSDYRHRLAADVV